MRSRRARITISLDPGVAAEIERRRQADGRSLQAEVDHLLRLGLRRADETPFHTETASVGRVLVDVDDVSDALAEVEGERFG